jgi:acyl carrier protein
MSTHHADDVFKTLQKWVTDSGHRHDGSSPARDADLIKEGWIDSIGLMTLISEVEDLLGRPLEDSEMRMQNFVSLDSIVRKFFAAARA